MGCQDVEPSSGAEPAQADVSSPVAVESPAEHQSAEPGSLASFEDDAFEYLRFGVNPQATTPELCLTFSAPLDPNTDYSAYAAVDEPVAYQVSGSRLCLGGLNYGQERTLTLRAGLPAADGRTLSADETVTLSFDDMPPHVGFSGEGIILPRLDADGLAIETVNVDTVAVDIVRVNDRALVFRNLGAGYSAASGEWYWGNNTEEPGELGSAVFSGRMDTEGALNARQITVLPLDDTLGTLEAGAYYVELRDAQAVDRQDLRPARAGRWLIVTDLAFTAYRGETGLDVVVRSLQTAQPQANVEVQLIARSNEVLGTARTNRQGRVRFDAPLTAGLDADAPALLTAYANSGDFALLDLRRAPVDLSDEPVSGRYRPGLVDAYLYLDRGIYRPGERIEASALLRNDQGQALTDRAGAWVLYQPNGLEQARFSFENARNAGGLSQSFVLPQAAARGNWRLVVELDGVGVIASTSLQVEDFVPQRVALDLRVDETPVLVGETRDITAYARFLYGAPGAGLPLEGTARVQREPNPFPAYDGYRFGRHDDPFAEQILNLSPTVADGEGMGVLTLDPGAAGERASYPLRLRTVVRVQEPGGRAVADDVRLPYRPRDTYWAVRPGFEGRAERRAEAAFEVLAVDALGAMIASEAQWRLVRKDYQYDWYRTGGQWRWRRTERVVPISSGLVELDGERAEQIETPPLDWGDYVLIVSVDGMDVASTQFWVGWHGQTRDGVRAPDQVRVAGPDSVSVGEIAELTLQAPYAGLAEVVIATDRVIETLQLAVPEGGVTLNVPVTEDWGAGAYVMASVYTPRSASLQPLPRRAVGVSYVPVDMSERTFDVVVEAPDVVEPNQPLTLGVRAVNGPVGETGWVTLAAVDEGVLLLTGFASPDPMQVLNGKPRLDVALFDDYGRLLDPNQGAAALVRSGGDQIGGAGLSVVPTRTVALFSGPVRLDRNGTAEITLDLPDFNGELRLMAVAWSETGLGATSQPITVRDDVPAELILPRFLAPGDQAQASLTLDNVAGTAGGYTAQVTTRGAVNADDEPRSIALDEGQRVDAGLAITGTAVGLGGFDLSVTGPGGFEAQSAYPIEVRSAFWPVSSVEQIVLQPGASYTPDPQALAGFLPGSGLLQVSTSASPIDAASLYQSLYNYPYACTEQLVSRTAPLLYAGQLATLAGENGPEGASGLIQSTIETLLARQSADGAFGLWRVGDQNASIWLGAYTADFLSRAAEQGHPVPRAALDRALNALIPVAVGEQWRAAGYRTYAHRYYSSDTDQRLADRSAAYALYVLARNGRADRSRLRYMHDERLYQIESPLARAQIGAALASLGDRARASNAFEAAIEALGYANEGDWYQTPTRDLAGVIALAVEAGQMDELSDLLERLSRDLRDPEQMTTQEKAFLIFAARAFAGDVEQLPVQYSGEARTSDTLMFDQQTLTQAGRLTNTGERPVYVSVMARGAPVEPPASAQQNLRLSKSITDLSGGAVDLSRIRQGDRLLVSLVLRPQRQAYASYILADLLPAGFEIEALVTPEEAGSQGVFSHLGDLSRPQVAEARDDRYVAAIDASSDDVVRLAYLVRAVTPGRYVLPGAVSEDMYRTDVFARTAADQVLIQP